ncbi:DUF6455 family protein [Shimia sp. NS0008-38b]|uniref:DUF6455 family protein n=1 Tax=Shimia sp. NS0008-38b TaxID=3127653 RepID=UPI0033409FD8
MKPLGDRRHHYWLAQRMAQLTQTDLVAAREAAALSQKDWAEMVEHCRGCDWEAGCGRWQAQQALADSPAENAPEGCANQARFAQLKTALEVQE